MVFPLLTQPRQEEGDRRTCFLSSMSIAVCAWLKLVMPYPGVTERSPKRKARPTRLNAARAGILSKEIMFVDKNGLALCKRRPDAVAAFWALVAYVEFVVFVALIVDRQRGPMCWR